MFVILKRFVLLLFVQSCLSLSTPRGPFNSKTSSHVASGRDPRSLLSSYGTENLWSIFRFPGRAASSTCTWDSKFQRCFISNSKLKHILEDLESHYSALLMNNEECSVRTTRISCEFGTSCYWNSDTELCEFRDFITGHETSPCILAAPGFFEQFSLSAICSKLNNPTTCQWNEKCRWDSEDKVCSPQALKSLFQIETDTEEFKKVYEDKFTEIKETVDSDPSVITHNSTWESILEWKIPQTVCPNESSTEVCDYVQAYLSVIAPAHYYCHWRYPASSDCADDPHCKYGDFGICGISDTVRLQAKTTATKLMISQMPDSVDKEILSLTYECPDFQESSSCSKTEHCIWHSLFRKCILKTTYVRGTIAKAGNDPTDPVCRYFGDDSHSNCVYQFDKESCKAKEFCRLSPSNRCYTSEEYFVAEAVQKHIESLNGYEKAKAQCSNAIFETTCSRIRQRQ